MPAEIFPPGFALLTDSGGVILQVLHNSLETISFIPGQSLVSLVHLNSRVKILVFLKELLASGAAFGWEITFLSGQQDEAVSLSGLVQGDQLLLLGACPPREEQTILKELISINNEQINTLRTTLKDQAQISPARTQDKALMEDMALMNNQLVNMQRELARKNRELERLYAEVQALSITDALTGQNNRRGLFQKGEHEVQVAKRYQRSLSVIMLDIDHFKRINDTFGHTTGDQVLRGLADWCSWQLRQVDIFGRYGGEEFAIVLPDTTLKNAFHVAERLRKISNHPIPAEAAAITITISLGVAALTPTTDTLETLLNAADQALYRAKTNGRNQTSLADPPPAP